MKLLVNIGLLVISIGGCGSMATAAEQPVKSFADWCIERNSLPPETQKTVDLLLQAAGKNDCRRGLEKYHWTKSQPQSNS
jgi:internalin A